MGIDTCGELRFNCKLVRLQIVILKENGIYVTGFGKICIVYKSNFAHLEIHKNHSDRNGIHI